MQHTIPTECGDCGRRAQQHSIHVTNDVGVIDTSITFIECGSCGRSNRETVDIENPVLQDLQAALRDQGDGIRDEYDVLRDDTVLVVHDQTGRLQSDMKRIFGSNTEHILHELARIHVPGEEWTHHPPITIVKRNDDAEPVTTCGECGTELAGCVDVTWVTYTDPETRAEVDADRYPVFSCRVCGKSVDRSARIEDWLLDSIDARGP